MADQRLAAPDRDIGRELLAQRRLADPRLADDQRQRPLPRDRRVEGRLQLLQLRLPPDEGAAIQRIGEGATIRSS